MSEFKVINPASGALVPFWIREFVNIKTVYVA
jgi:hypothetical protein